MSDWLHLTFEYWRSGGILLAPLALVCVGIITIFIRTRSHLVGLLNTSRALLDRLMRLAPGSGPDAVRNVSNGAGGISLLIHQAVDATEKGSELSDWFPRRQDRTRFFLGRDLTALSALTAMAPLLGLLGTVAGMIATFDAVALSGGETATKVAGGISTALITTQFGLIIALPGVFGLVRLEKWLRVLDVRLAECRMYLGIALGEKRP